MYKKILVPLDGSKRAEAIMPHVEEMAHRYGATVVLLEVAEPSTVMAGPHGAVPDYKLYLDTLQSEKASAEKYLAGWHGIFEEKGIPTVYVVEAGGPVQRIMEVAEREDVDVIAMSSHGRTGLALAFYGSVAAGVLHQTDRPLMLIRATRNG